MSESNGLALRTLQPEYNLYAREGMRPSWKAWRSATGSGDQLLRAGQRLRPANTAVKRTGKKPARRSHRRTLHVTRAVSAFPGGALDQVAGKQRSRRRSRWHWLIARPSIPPRRSSAPPRCRSWMSWSAPLA
ncbi:hypothetical protein M8494_02435 [Serratia ureilytica]